MTTFDFVMLTTGLAALAFVGFFVLRRVLPARNLRLVRCPENGAIAFVGAETRARGDATVTTVRSCDLWPQNAACSQDCLQRYEETGPGYRINIDALRPFERK